MIDTFVDEEERLLVDMECFDVAESVSLYIGYVEKRTSFLYEK